MTNPNKALVPVSVLDLSTENKTFNGSMFLQGHRGITSSAERRHPEIFDLYKKLKSMDWDEHEFELEQCAVEFKTRPEGLCRVMLETLAWQYEGDHVAANSLAPVVAPFVTDPDLWRFYGRVGDNESLHALAYEEIERYGIGGDAADVFRGIVENHEAARRLSRVATAMGRVKEISHKVGLGLIARDSDEAIEGAMLFVAAVFVLERLQFMVSFAVTFAIGQLGAFMPIVDTVQKIMTEEWTIHVKGGKYVIGHELTVEHSRQAIDRVWPVIEELISGCLEDELHWNYNHLFANGYQLPGVTPQMLEDWALYAVNDIYATFKKPNPHRIVSENPLPYMNRWIDINKNQGSPQEKRSGNYPLGGIVSGFADEDVTFDLEGL